jgi:hypothetical protein
VGVIRRKAGWRWGLVVLGVAVLCALPAIASALPVSAPAVTAGQLRARILASARLSYSGYAESDATFGLPSLTGLSDVTSLLDGVTKMEVWQAAPDSWRVDVLSDTGERDTYQTPRSTYIWDSGSELLTRIVGQPGIRLPRAADLLPPALASRLLQEAGTSATSCSAARGPGSACCSSAPSRCWSRCSWRSLTSRPRRARAAPSCPPY